MQVPAAQSLVVLQGLPKALFAQVPAVQTPERHFDGLLQVVPALPTHPAALGPHTWGSAQNGSSVPAGTLTHCPNGLHALQGSSQMLLQQAPSTHSATSAAQSVVLRHVFPPPHRRQVVPPQSTSLSSAFFTPSETDRQVVAVYFNEGGVVESVANYGLKDGKVFDFISRTTPAPGGKDEGILKSLFRNLGKKQLFGE